MPPTRFALVCCPLPSPPCTRTLVSLQCWANDEEYSSSAQPLAQIQTFNSWIKDDTTVTRLVTELSHYRMQTLEDILEIIWSHCLMWLREVSCSRVHSCWVTEQGSAPKRSTALSALCQEMIATCLQWGEYCWALTLPTYHVMFSNLNPKSPEHE